MATLAEARKLARQVFGKGGKVAIGEPCHPESPWHIQAFPFHPLDRRMVYICAKGRRAALAGLCAALTALLEGR